MKKLVALLFLVTILAVPAYAKFSSKGAIPGAAPVEYRGLVVREAGVDIVMINRSETETVKFSAALTFLAARKEVADTFIEEITLAPQEQLSLTQLYIKGDVKAAKKADQLRWTIYKLDKK